MNDDLIYKIKEKKEILKDKITILAHHYQNIEIVKLSDVIGDSYKLAVEGSRSKSEFIVFCGVKFMAEGAAILAKETQKIVIPDMKAGCPMAEMVDAIRAKEVYERIREGCNKEVAPVVYVNSYGDMKNFCGERGGATCTSSKAKKILEYYFNQGKRVFFSPDYNLGINTAKSLNLKKEEIVKVKRNLSFEGNIKNARLFIWDGFCIVHKLFTTSDIIKLREAYKDIKIIVHPECDEEVVSMSDLSGSTEKIWNSVKDGKPGSIWGVGTEFNFVKRLAGECQDKKIIPLRASSCSNMEEISLSDLAMSLNSISDYLEGKGELKFEIKASETFKEHARKSLEKMIEISEGK
jgi:quinolinate synthase